MKSAKIVLLAAIASMSAGAFAGEVYGGVGTTGVTLGYTHTLTDNFGVRAEANMLNFNKNVDSNNVTYDARIKFQDVGLYGDYHPFGGGFRVSAGVLVGHDKISGTANGNSGTVDINGTSYNIAGESLTLDAKFPDVRPTLALVTVTALRRALASSPTWA